MSCRMEKPEMGILRLLSCPLSSRKSPVSLSLQVALFKNNRLVVLFIVVILK